MVSDPLTGVGARAFPVAEGTLSPLAVRQEYGIGLKWSAAHNSFVQIGAELGILGLIAFVAAIGTALRSLSRVANRSTHSGAVSLARALSASLVGYCAAGFFLSQAYGSGLYLLLALAIALAAIAPAIPVTAVAPRRVRPRRATRAAVAHQRAAARPRRFPRESASAGRGGTARFHRDQGFEGAPP
jgi:O-antigen ligase